MGYECAATVERDGRFWMVTVDGVGVTQARHLREVEAMARDLVVVMTGRAAGEVAVNVHVVLPPSVSAHLEQADQLRREAAKAQAAAASEVRAAARELAGLGLPLRDIGQVLGISHQRAHQLMS